MIRIVFLVLGLLSGGAAFADDHCGTGRPMFELEGTYEVVIGAGLMEGDGKVLMTKSLNTFEATFRAQDDLLMLEADQTVVVFEWAHSAAGALNFKEVATVMNMPLDDLAILSGCSVDTLPVLHGGGRTQSTDGFDLEFEYDLAHTGRGIGNQFFGAVYWLSGGIQTVRAVSVTQID